MQLTAGFAKALAGTGNMHLEKEKQIRQKK